MTLTVAAVEEGGPGTRTHLEENQIGLKEKKKKKKSGISAMSKPSFPLVMIENVK